MSSPKLLNNEGETTGRLTPRRVSLLERVVLTLSAICLLAGIYLRVAAANDYLWLDELHTGWTVGGRGSDVYWRSVDGNQSPLFFYLCFAVVNLFGYSASALRAVSLAGSILLIIGLPVVVYRAGRCAAAVLMISLFLMLDYDCVFYGSEARPYGMLQWLGGLQAFCFWRWIRRVLLDDGEVNDGEVKSSSFARGRISWPVVSLLSAAVVATHITGSWLLLAEAIFVLVVCLVLRRSPPAEAWKCAALFLVMALPSVLTFVTAWQRRANWASVSNVDWVATQFAWAFGAMVLLPALILSIDRWLSLPKERDSKASWMLFAFVSLWALVPTLTIVVLDYVDVAPLGLSRYAAVGSIALPLFGALAISRMKSKVLRWGTMVIVAGFLVFNSTYWIQPTLPPISDLRNENWADPVATIADGDPAYPVLLAGNVLEDVDARHDRSPRFQDYLKFPVLGARPNLKNPILPLNSQGELFTDECAVAIEAAGGGWLIVRELPENAPLILQQIEQNPRADKWQFDLAAFPAPVPNYVLLFRIVGK